MQEIKLYQYALHWTKCKFVCFNLFTLIYTLKVIYKDKTLIAKLLKKIRGGAFKGDNSK